jgi:hypothetical protein
MRCEPDPFNLTPLNYHWIFKKLYLCGVHREHPILTRVIWSKSDDEIRMGYRKGCGKLAQAWRIIRRSGTVFFDQLALSGPDPDHSVGEPRYITNNKKIAAIRMPPLPQAGED